MRRLMVEFIGTFFLALIMGFSGNYIAIGVFVICYTFLASGVSGAQLNPAVTLVLWMKKRMTASDAIGYIIAQFAGVFTAVVLFYLFIGRSYVLYPQQDINILKPLVVETLFTFLIVIAYLKSQASGTKNGYIYGLAIMVAGLSGAAISGGAFNPALGLAPALAELIIKSGYPLSHCWIYFAGPLAGAVSALAADTYIFKQVGNGTES